MHHRSAGKVSTFWTGCGVIKRHMFIESGGFNEHYLKPSIEDIELGMRLSEKGREIRLFPELQVKHNKAWTITNWLKTDLFLRGIPWIRLMKTRKQWIPQLNFTPAHRLSAVVVLMLLPVIPSAFFLSFSLAGYPVAFPEFSSFSISIFFVFWLREPVYGVLPPWFLSTYAFLHDSSCFPGSGPGFGSRPRTP